MINVEAGLLKLDISSSSRGTSKRTIFSTLILVTVSNLTFRLDKFVGMSGSFWSSLGYTGNDEIDP